MKAFIPLIALLVTVIAGTVGAVNYFAKVEDLKLVELRLEQKIQQDQIYFIQQRLWQLYDRYGTDDCNRMPHPACGECRQLKLKLTELTRSS